MATTTDDRELVPARLRPAQPGRSAAPALGDTLLTVLLVLYPALGALGLIVAGLLFSGAGA